MQASPVVNWLEACLTASEQARLKRVALQCHYSASLVWYEIDLKLACFRAVVNIGKGCIWGYKTKEMKFKVLFSLMLEQALSNA